MAELRPDPGHWTWELTFISWHPMPPEFPLTSDGWRVPCWALLGGMKVPEAEFLCKALTAYW